MSEAAYTQDRRQAKSDYKKDLARNAREVGDIPPPLDIARRRSAEHCLKTFCETYCSETFTLGWSPDHLDAIRLMQTAILEGGQFALAMPRGSGKTSLCEAAATWAALYGHRKFIVIVGSEASLAQTIVDNMKCAIETSDRITEDFPEVCLPIQALEGISQRAKGQICGGERTHVEWSADKVKLPTIEGSQSSGVIIIAKGLTGAIRGLKERTADGDQLRPDLVLLDDPQTDQSARTPSQVDKRKRLITQAILGLAGPGKKIAALMPCTVIQEGDMADQMLDRNTHPEWHGRRTAMLLSMPSDSAMKLWEKYEEIKKVSLREERGISDATEFYRQNRIAMDDGAKASWDERYNHDEISAIQHAMNLYLTDKGSFYSEYQNAPIKDDDAGTLRAEHICTRINGHARRLVPAWGQQVTAYIDVQMNCMYYLVTAWGEGMQGAVIDYGSYPEQPAPYWTYKSIKRKLKDEAGTDDLLGYLYYGLDQTVKSVIGRTYETDNGHELPVARCLIDASWGDSTDTVYQYARQSEFRHIITPAHGRGITASSRDLNDQSPKPGDKSGHYWRIPASGRTRAVRHVLYDTNYWKTWTQSALMAKMGMQGSISLWGRSERDHELFADHCASEYCIKTFGRSREVYEWNPRPDGRDNHWWDCLVGSAVAASMSGMMAREWRRRNDTVNNRPKRKVRYGAITTM